MAMSGGLSEEALARLMRCPSCGSGEVEIMVRESSVGAAVGPIGFGAVGKLKTPRRVRCRVCGHEWTRSPMVELVRQATRDVTDRLTQAEERNRRLREGLAQGGGEAAGSAGAGSSADGAGPAHRAGDSGPAKG
jgi:DNA-directed RNA polymerase subunit RPC12/RpoP